VFVRARSKPSSYPIFTIREIRYFPLRRLTIRIEGKGVETLDLLTRINEISTKKRGREHGELVWFDEYFVVRAALLIPYLERRRAQLRPRYSVTLSILRHGRLKCLRTIGLPFVTR